MSPPDEVRSSLGLALAMTMQFFPHAKPYVKIGTTTLDGIDAISPHPDGTSIVVCSNGAIQILAWPSLARIARSKEPGPRGRAPSMKTKRQRRDDVAQALHTPNGAEVIAVGPNRVAALDPKTAALAREITTHDALVEHDARDEQDRWPMSGLAMSPDGSRMVVVDERGLVIDVATGERLLELATGADVQLYDRAVRRVAWSPDGNRIAIRFRARRSHQKQYEEGVVAIHDAKTGARLAKLPGLGSDGCDVAFLPDGSLVTAISENALGVWASGRWKEPARTVPTPARAGALAVSRSGLIALYCAWTIDLYSSRFELLGKVPVDANHAIHCIAFSADEGVLFAGSGPVLHAWTTFAPAEPIELKPPSVRVTLRGYRTAPREVDLTRVSWLSKIGAFLVEDAATARVETLDDWPGPDHEGVDAFLAFLNDQHEQLAHALRATGVVASDQTWASVLERAEKVIPDHPNVESPNRNAPATVASVAMLVERYRALGWELPEVIETIWAWCLDGRWPCGFDRKPGKLVRLLVL